MTFFQIAVLALLALNGWITYRTLRRLAIASLVGSFAVAHWLNPVRAEWFKETHAKSLAAEDDDAKYEKLSAQLAEEDPECPRGRESLAKRRHIPYLQIDLFPNEWATHGIGWEMKARSDEACLQNDDVRFSHADLIRENFWLDKVEGGLKEGQVLITCGYLHLHFLANNIRARNGTVVEKCTYPTSLLDRSPTKTLSPDELKRYLREQNDVTGI